MWPAEKKKTCESGMGIEVCLNNIMLLTIKLQVIFKSHF